jgi:hypothetical protein
MIDDKLIELIESFKNKPTSYHYLCWAGTTTEAINSWGNEPLLKCHYYQIVVGLFSTNMGKGCGYTDTECYCKGTIQGDWELRDMERHENYGIEKVIRKLKEDK